MRRLQWYKCGAAYNIQVKGGEEWVKSQRNPSPIETPVFIGVSADLVKGKKESGCFTAPDVSFCAWQWQVIALVRGNVMP